MKKSLTINELIKELKNLGEEYGDVEVFVANSETAQFDGVTKAFVILSKKDDSKYAGLIANGDILKI